MVVVAIAGTGGVGRTVLDAIVKSGKHKAVILSRTATTATTANESRRFAVDYNNIEQLKHVLQKNNVEVVISTLLLVDEVVAQSQTNLIRAAAQSGTVTKFVPSEYYIDFHAPVPRSSLFGKFEIEAEKELSRHPQLTWTLIRLGIFLDHLTMPHNSLPTHISPFWAFVDIDHEQCVFPGDGSQPLILTHSTDLGAYVERLVGLESEDWPRESFIASNKLQVKDLTSMLKKTTGKDFKVTFDSIEAIHRGQITSLPSNLAIFKDPIKGEFFKGVELEVMLSILSNAYDLPGKNLAELFPDVQTVNIEDFLRQGWALKQEATSS